MAWYKWRSPRGFHFFVPDKSILIHLQIQNCFSNFAHYFKTRYMCKYETKLNNDHGIYRKVRDLIGKNWQNTVKNAHKISQELVKQLAHEVKESFVPDDGLIDLENQPLPEDGFNNLLGLVMSEINKPEVVPCVKDAFRRSIEQLSPKNIKSGHEIDRKSCTVKWKSSELNF